MMIIDFGSGIRVAAPTAVLAAMVDAARRGILFKGGRSLEDLQRVDTVVFDKTGTLTQGVLHLGRIHACHPRRLSPHAILALAAAVESKVCHPIAKAITGAAARLGLEVPRRTRAQFRVGLGAEAEVDGHHVVTGSERFLRQHAVRLTGSVSTLRTLGEAGYACTLVAVDGEFAGVIPYRDAVRPEAGAVIRTLRNFGVRDVMLLSGDSGSVTRAVATEIGIAHNFSEVLPPLKAELVQRLRSEGRTVAMVGDGINDSAALSHANVGVAMHLGADITREAADVILMESNLWKLISAFELSRSAMRNVRQDFGIIAAFNALAYALLIPEGFVTPATTAGISNGSAIVACLNAIRPLLKY
jgi:Cu2+-exporting ATPase